MGVYRDCPIFFSIISGTGKATNFKFGRYIHRVHPNKSPLKFWEKMKPGTAQIFWVPPIISGTGKATNFKFCTHILSIDRNKSPLQISGKVAGCVVRTLKTFQGTHILGAWRSLLCDSSAVLLTYPAGPIWPVDPEDAARPPYGQYPPVMARFCLLDIIPWSWSVGAEERALPRATEGNRAALINMGLRSICGQVRASLCLCVAYVLCR